MRSYRYTTGNKSRPNQVNFGCLVGFIIDLVQVWSKDFKSRIDSVDFFASGPVPTGFHPLFPYLSASGKIFLMVHESWIMSIEPMRRNSAENDRLD